MNFGDIVQWKIFSDNFQNIPRTRRTRETFEKANYFCKYLNSGFQLLTSFNILSPHISGGKQKASNKSETLKLWRREIFSQILEYRFSREKYYNNRQFLKIQEKYISPYTLQALSYPGICLISSSQDNNKSDKQF